MVADPHGKWAFIECTAECLIRDAYTDLLEGEGHRCECEKPCEDRKACAQRWLDGGRGTMSFKEACAILRLDRGECDRLFGTMLYAKKCGMRGGKTGFEGIGTAKFRNQVSLYMRTHFQPLNTKFLFGSKNSEDWRSVYFPGRTP